MLLSWFSKLFSTHPCDCWLCVYMEEQDFEEAARDAESRRYNVDEGVYR
jgi:hypothetical protein